MLAIAAIAAAAWPPARSGTLCVPRPSVSDRRPHRTSHSAPFALQPGRQILELVLIAAATAGLLAAWRTIPLTPRAVCLLVVVLALAKTVFFLVENLQHILLATAQEIPYHRFLGLMGVNMTQITLSFALDFWVLEWAEEGSFSGFHDTADLVRVFFDCFFFSVLNFTFFGFGEIMPQTIPAKIVTLLEVVLAFFTVIFLLSDFISLKDSLRREQER
jgi:Na+/H+ antiporter NhaD/arsenite permease-like protein